jgi:transglutaminase-like putative cysteine protease
MVMRLVAFVPALLALGLLAIIGATAELLPAFRAIAIGCIVLSVLAGALFGRETMRLHASVVLAVAAVTAMGQTRSGIPFGMLPYDVGCIAFALGAIACLRAPHLVRTKTVEHGSRTRAAITIVVVGTLVTLGLATQLPRVAVAVEHRVTALFVGGSTTGDAQGFSARMALGSLRGMLQSDRVVMRVRGARVDYLRGAVFDTYDGRAWSSSTDDRRIVRAATADEAVTTTTIVFARSALAGSGREARWFLPAGACETYTGSGEISIDAAGIAHPEPVADADEIRFRTSSTCSAPLIARAPTDADTTIPPALRARIAPVGASWTAGAGSVRAKLETLTRELGRFRYSLDTLRDTDIDPIEDLLTRHHEGHCEIFAAALVMLARAEAIPARVVTGYRVSEENPLMRYAVVRERNAHAWVEAWVDGTWTRFDPTPITEGRPAHSSALASVLDLASFASDRAVTMAARVGVVRLLASLAALGFALLVARRLYVELRARRRKTKAPIVERPLPCFNVLEGALAQIGHARLPSEPLERFAGRMASLDEPWAGNVAAAVLRYAGLGTESDVARVLEQIAAELPRKSGGVAR